jgi:hypothetical protein
LDGWLKAASGEARLSLEFLDEKGQALGRAEAPALQQVGDWRYLAVECPSGAAVAARVLFWVKGEADLDDVALAAVATSYIGNKSVEGDDRGRVAFWGEEKDSTLRPGRCAGRGRLDASVRHTGKTSLELTATGPFVRARRTIHSDSVGSPCRTATTSFRRAWRSGTTSRCSGEPGRRP